MVAIKEKRNVQLEFNDLDTMGLQSALWHILAFSIIYY